MKLIHAADLHIDSPLRGLGHIEGAPIDEIRRATRTAFRKLIDLCLQQAADVLLLAGDIFDGEWRDFNTGLFFIRELARLRDISTQVIMIRGNHDAESVLVNHIPLPDHVCLLSAEKPQTVILERLGVAVHGQSYATKSIVENLAHAYPKAINDCFNIGLLHTNAVGSTEHDNYAPCTIHQLAAHGYDYWALGHVHKHAILHREPWVVYPGNLQGRHARETGPKGCTIITLEGQHITEVVQQTVDVLRWSSITISPQKTEKTDGLLEDVYHQCLHAIDHAEGRPVLARITIESNQHVHGEFLRNSESILAQIQAIAANAGEIWPEKILFRAHRPKSPIHQGELISLRRALHHELTKLEHSPQALEPYRKSLQSLATSVASYLGVRPNDPSWLKNTIKDVESLLLATLTAETTNTNN